MNDTASHMSSFRLRGNDPSPTVCILLCTKSPFQNDCNANTMATGYVAGKFRILIYKVTYQFCHTYHIDR